MHVDKIDHHNAAHIAQAQLAGNFTRCFFIHLKGVLFLVFFIGSSVTTVYVDNVQCLGMLNNKVGTASQVYCFTKCTFYLFVDTVIFKYRLFVFVQANDVFQFGRDLVHIGANFLENGILVNVNMLEIRVQDISQQC